MNLSNIFALTDSSNNESFINIYQKDSINLSLRYFNKNGKYFFLTINKNKFYKARTINFDCIYKGNFLLKRMKHKFIELQDTIIDNKKYKHYICLNKRKSLNTKIKTHYILTEEDFNNFIFFSTHSMIVNEIMFPIGNYKEIYFTDIKDNVVGRISIHKILKQNRNFTYQEICP